MSGAGTRSDPWEPGEVDVASTPRTTAVVTWFRPPPEALDALDDAVRECADVVVVDNTPGGEPGLADVRQLPPSVRVLRPGRNAGLAAALNLGVQQVPPSSEAVLLLDQDSRLPVGMVDRLWVHLQEPRTGAAAPAPWDAAEGRYLDPRTSSRPEVADRPVVITSGLLVRRAALEEVGAFREDFFVDSVDLDYCLRLRQAGWRVVQDRTVRLSHRLGETRWHRVLGVGVRASHHPSWRLYSAARNCTVLTREHLHSEPRWALANVLLLAYWALTVACFEPPRRSRLLLLLRGAVDGWRGAPPAVGPPS